MVSVANLFCVRSELEKQLFDDMILMKPPLGVGFHKQGSGFRIIASTLSVRPFILLFLCGLAWPFIVLPGEPPESPEGMIFISFILFMTASAIIWLFISIFGKVVVFIDGENSYVFVGVGPIGCTKRFDWNTVTAVRETKELDYLAGWVVGAVQIEARKTITFGRLLSKKRVHFIAEALKYAILRRL